MTAKELKTLLEKVPDEAVVDLEILKIDGTPVFPYKPLSEELQKKVDGYLWLEIEDLVEFSWEETTAKYWHLKAGIVNGDG
jgi:hypothetical protein|tara:strand:+ start:1433 stop:1675 length:243 start_codon:yes stop_codon:yes gene_type:complete